MGVLLAASMVLSAAGCGSAGSSSQASSAAPASSGAASQAAPAASAGGKIKIAVAGPMTGDNAEYGKGFLNAAQLKADEWNAAGGVTGKQVEIVAYDDKNSSKEAASIAQKIVSEGDIVGVIGHFSSGVCMTAAPVYQENKIIEISPSASHPDYSGIGTIFSATTPSSTWRRLPDWILPLTILAKKNIGIISIMTDWGTNTSRS